MKATTKKAAPLADLVEEFDCEQRSDQWYELRLGIATASNFSAIMAESEERAGRAKLLHRLAAEVIFKRPMETFSNAAMSRGIEQEPALLQHYAFTRGVDVRRVGFVRRTIRDPLFGEFVVGCSPDGLVGTDGVIQTKSSQPDLILQMQDSGRFPSEHRWQCHGELFVTGRKWNDLVIGYEDFPISLTYRFERNEAEIAKIKKEVELFDHDLRQLVDRARKRGGLR